MGPSVVACSEASKSALDLTLALALGGFPPRMARPPMTARMSSALASLERVLVRTRAWERTFSNSSQVAGGLSGGGMPVLGAERESAAAALRQWLAWVLAYLVPRRWE